MNTTNFYTPTTLTYSLIDVLTFYGLGLHVTNYEQQEPIYRFHKKTTITKTKILTMLGFGIEETLFSHKDRAEVTKFIQAYIKANCPDAVEIKDGIYQINM
jgi:hypothetical protein